MRILEAAWSLRDTRASLGCGTISLKLSGTGIELSAIATESGFMNKHRICRRSAVPVAMHADLLFTIHTLNRVVDSKVSSWDPKLAADLVNSVRAVSESGCHLA